MCVIIEFDFNLISRGLFGYRCDFEGDSSDFAFGGQDSFLATEHF